MQSWTITAFSSTIALREGTADDLPQAWAQAAAAVLDGLTVGEFDRCAIVVDDGPPALLIAGRGGDGQIDLDGAREAVQRMAVAGSDWPFH